MAKVICPKCDSNFEASQARTYKGLLADLRNSLHATYKAPEHRIDESSFVRCPDCGAEFKSEAVRYFGILSPKGVKILLGLFVFGFFCVALYVLFSSI